MPRAAKHQRRAGQRDDKSAPEFVSFARAQATRLGLRSDFLSDREIHIHVPAGGVPKDGPSAGITMACVLVSLVSGIPVRRDVAMTGEITLRGRVLPVGGLKEKLLAAVRAGMRVAIVPATNMAELSELPAHLRERIKIQPVHSVDEALVISLTRPLSHPKAAAVAPRRPAANVVAPPRRGGAA